uniref:Uncharacterized protein n=1 Tax=Arundo donax TaxID=35708 RepID=A0A0A9HVK1_ARUDO
MAEGNGRRNGDGGGE